MGISKTINSYFCLKSSQPKGLNVSAGEWFALRIVIAGGGTGGHLFPGIAIAEAFMDRQPQTRILFVSSGKKIEETVLSKTAFEKKKITIEGIKGKRLSAKLISLFKLPVGMIESLRLLIQFKPDVVIGMGAYSAGPVVVSAWMLRICRVICEQNSIPGITNKLLSHVADRIYVSFQDTQISSFDEKIVFTGNPVRKEIVKAIRERQNIKAMAKDKDRVFDVLVLGGSQGAHSINMAMMDAVKYLKNPSSFKFSHQTGLQDVDAVRKAYLQNAVAFDVELFFEDMATRYQNADLVICRAGATTVAELTIAGNAVIFIPFPFATDNHQVVNAQALVDGGAAEMIQEKDLTGKILAERMAYYAENPEVKGRMESKIRQFGHPDAAQRIVDDIYRMIHNNDHETACVA